MKKILGAVMGCLFTAIAWAPVSANYTPSTLDPIELSRGQYISLADSSFGPWSSRVTSRANARDEILCETLTGECSVDSKQARQISANLNWTICDSVTEIDCVKSLRIQGSSYELISLPGDEVDGVQALFLPSGAGPVLASGPEGDFIISTRGEYQFDPGKLQFLTRALDVELVPVVIQPGNYEEIRMVQNDAMSSRTVGERGANPKCYFNTASVCYQSDPARLADLEINLQLQLSSKWSGFFKGRLTQPLLKLSKNNGVQVLNLSAQPASTHKVFFKVNWDAYGKAQEDAICFGSSWCEGLRVGATGLRTQLSSAPGSIAIIQAFGKHHLDTAAEDVYEWSFGVGRSIGENCLAPNRGLVGMVTSNAPVFQAGPPTFQSGYLTYDIAGLHYASDGKTLNIGEYNLQIRSDVARCLYGFSNAPVSATVQVTNEAGKQVVATKVVSETDGWLRLNANGFTYSKKRVKVKISQPVQATLPTFTAESVKLSSSQSSFLKQALASKISGTELTCTGVYSSSAKASLAKKQAEATCAAAKKFRPSLKTSTFVTSASSAGVKVGSVLLRSN